MRKPFNQIRTSETHGDHRLARFVNLFRQRRLLCGNVHIPLAIAHAHKQRKNRNVVGIRRRQFQNRSVHKTRVCSQRGHRVESRTQFAFQVFTRIRLRIGVKSQQQRAPRFRRIEWQLVARIPQQGHTAVGNFLRFFLQLGAAELFVDGVHVHETVCIQPQPRFCLKNPPHRCIETLFRNSSRLHRRLQRFESRIWHRRHQHTIGSRHNRAHRRFPGCVAHSNSAHVHRVGDDEALIAKLLAQHIREDVV